MMRRFLIAACAWCLMQTAHALTVLDDTGRAVTLARPAQRVISLAPHATELVFAAGGGAHLVGVIAYSDFPNEAKRIPVIGDSRQIDIERLLALKPDLLVVWPNGNSARQLAQLQRLSIPIFFSEPARLEALPDAVLRLGQLLGTNNVATQRATEMRQKLFALTAKYNNRPVVKIFYQVWSAPLYTINGRHIISDAIRLCGGENIFDALSTVSPVVDIEAVLQKNPEAIVTAADRQQSDSGLAMWQRYPAMLAVKRKNLIVVDADFMSRAGPRLIDGAGQLCERIELVRSGRGSIR